LETLAEKVSEWGFDGLELACWDDHFENDRAMSEDGYIQSRHDIPDKYGLKCYAISNHLVGQYVCGVKFIEKVVESSQSDVKWLKF
jgi:sugar phosphate isomerase/epimerase